MRWVEKCLKFITLLNYQILQHSNLKSMLIKKKCMMADITLSSHITGPGAVRKIVRINFFRRGKNREYDIKGLKMSIKPKVEHIHPRWTPICSGREKIRKALLIGSRKDSADNWPNGYSASFEGLAGRGQLQLRSLLLIFPRVRSVIIRAVLSPSGFRDTHPVQHSISFSLPTDRNNSDSSSWRDPVYIPVFYFLLLPLCNI